MSAPKMKLVIACEGGEDIVLELSADEATALRVGATAHGLTIGDYLRHRLKGLYNETMNKNN